MPANVEAWAQPDRSTRSHQVAKVMTRICEESCGSLPPRRGFMQKTTISGWGLATVFLAGILVTAPLATAQDSHWEAESGPSIVATAGMVPTTDLAQPGQ